MVLGKYLIFYLVNWIFSSSKLIKSARDLEAGDFSAPMVSLARTATL
jgi:hypothetical protein